MHKSSNPVLNLALNPATYRWLELGNCSLNLQCRKHHENFSLIYIMVKGLCVGNGTHLGGTILQQNSQELELPQSCHLLTIRPWEAGNRTGNAEVTKKALDFNGLTQMNSVSHSSSQK